MMHSLCTHHGCRWPDCSLGSCPTYEVLTRREETYLRWHQPMHSSHHDSDSMRLIRLWATREETKLSSRPPKLLLRMNHKLWATREETKLSSRPPKLLLRMNHKLWATREETKLSSRPPKLLLRIHNYSWRHLLHNRWRLLLCSSVLRVGVDVLSSS